MTRHAVIGAMPNSKVKGVNGFAIALLCAGGGIIYAGAKGFSIAAVFHSLIEGKDPSKLAQMYPVDQPIIDVHDPSTAGGPATGASSVVSSSGSFGSNSAIANAAMKYNHTTLYIFGKARPYTGWDCSGFVNYVLGHDLGMTLPGGVKNFDGSWHGPVSAQYCLWSGAVTVPRGDCQAGDIVTYGVGHMGIAVGPNSVINAYETGHLTEVLPLEAAGYQRPILIRRVLAQR